MEEFYKNFLQNPIFSQLFASAAVNGNLNSQPQPPQQQPQSILQQQQQPQQPLPVTGLPWLDTFVNQENKLNGNAPVPDNGQQQQQQQQQRLLQNCGSFLDASKMMPVPGATTKSEPVVSSNGPGASSTIINSTVINNPPQQQIGSHPMVKEETRSSSTNNNNNNNNNTSNTTISQPSPQPGPGGLVLSPPSMINSWHQQAAEQFQKATMAEQLHMMGAFGFPGVGFGSFNQAVFQPQLNGHPQPPPAAHLSTAMFPPRPFPLMNGGGQSPFAQPVPLPEQPAPPPPPPPPPPQPPQSTHPQESDQFYAQLIQDTLRQNMAVAAASLFSGAPSIQHNAATTSPLWAALIAQQIQQIAQPQPPPPPPPPQQQQANQQAMLQFQTALNDQLNQQQRKCESDKNAGLNGDTGGIIKTTLPPSFSQSQPQLPSQQQQPQQNFPVKVSTGTSPGVSNGANDMAALGSHERVHYWLYGQSMTGSLSNTPGRETSPVNVQTSAPPKQQPPPQQQQQPLQTSPSFPVLPLPPAPGGSIVTGQPILPPSQPLQQQQQPQPHTGFLSSIVPNVASLVTANGGSHSNPNSRPSSRMQQSQQQTPHRMSSPLLNVGGAPDAKRPRIATPASLPVPKTEAASKAAEQLEHIPCGQMTEEERLKHYEEIIDYVIANAHLMSPPKTIGPLLDSSPTAADLTSSTPSYSNSNIGGSLAGSSSGNNVNNAIHDATSSLLLLQGSDMNANSPILNTGNQATQGNRGDELSPSSSSNNSPFANLNGSGNSCNHHNNNSQTSIHHSMPKKAWLQRLNESTNNSFSNQPQTAPQSVPPPDNQFSPTMSTSSSKSPAHAQPLTANGDDKTTTTVPRSMNLSPVSPSSIYLQPAPCMLAAPKMAKCRECRLAQTNRPQNESCRFEGFRRLRRTSRDHILSEGFLTLADVRPEDETMWIPPVQINTKATLPHSLARYAVGQLSTEFIAMCRQELGVIFSLRGNLRSLAWRRREDRMRELCDVCQTTLFNLHWFCVKCGFVACLECFQQRQSEIQGGLPEAKRWLTCLSANRAKHESDKLLPAVIIPPQCMQQVVAQVEKCISTPQPIDGLLVAAEAAAKSDSAAESARSPSEEKQPPSISSPLDILAEVASNSLVHNPAPRIPPQPSSYELINGQQLVRFFSSSTNETLWSLGQELLQQGKPFVVSNIKFQENWSPDMFISRFSQVKLALVNCVALTTVDNVSHNDFWNGFRSVRARLCEPKTPNAICLKLKDWPPDARFADLLPDHFADLISALPLPIYSTPGGALNLPTYLPSSFVAPDLGPKLYAAYGTGSHFRTATTALHLDIADAFNVNIHVHPLEDDGGAELKAAREYVEMNPFVPEEFKRRMRAGDLPGAIWHLFDTKDAEHIRTYINQNKGGKDQRLKDAAVRSSADPIHDQVWYLDDQILAELHELYNVVPYTIIQFEGDGIFIPAGCAHQVRNLMSCLKVAIDFVCPERVSVCHKLTDEFRRLPDSHLNHEDKLQLKNILYHAVKEVVAAASLNSITDSVVPPQVSQPVIDATTTAAPIVAPSSPSSSSLASSDQRSPNLVIELDQGNNNNRSDDEPMPPISSNFQVAMS